MGIAYTALVKSEDVTLKYLERYGRVLGPAFSKYVNEKVGALSYPALAELATHIVFSNSGLVQPGFGQIQNGSNHGLDHVGFYAIEPWKGQLLVIDTKHSLEDKAAGPSGLQKYGPQNYTRDVLRRELNSWRKEPSLDRSELAARVRGAIDERVQVQGWIAKYNYANTSHRGVELVRWPTTRSVPIGRKLYGKSY